VLAKRRELWSGERRWRALSRTRLKCNCPARVLASWDGTDLHLHHNDPQLRSLVAVGVGDTKSTQNRGLSVDERKIEVLIGAVNLCVVLVKSRLRSEY
jgi:hypothetical protein